MISFPFDTQELVKICKQNDILKIGVFGSFAKGEFTEDSDIDLLVEFGKPKSLLKFVKLERQISEILGRKVDLLTEASISPYLREQIKSELRVIYEA